ncbi:uracil-xanthine permease family protein [Parasphaerochaeta coccoides]|uniref:Xanthine/uracil/vitamin C permease n=1 Tax=Parasphaerochaeta coccoides (strain ATCC BAA-1237 / DSM 17374 / SPN1) TaxID=760011 RepID=F4GJQ9_PARC1|nr:solute carrier family 23 protein [Parasphaerochaeta coccoides]AEC02806.1 Xanthine/uracil/vitamin C permease [Parasphaerochaeta coccoides DSM 17374]
MAESHTKSGFWGILGFTKGTSNDGLLPSEAPGLGRLFLLALQQFIVMFPATVLVAILTGFHVSTTIFASGLATLSFLLVTRGQIPLYYGSSFSYIAAIVAITGGGHAGGYAPDHLIGQAQFGIMMSGLVSIFIGLLVNKLGFKRIEKFLPPTVTGPIAMIIGVSLMGTALSQASEGWIVSLVTLLATIVFSVTLKGVLGQLPILFGILVGYIVALITGQVDFSAVNQTAFFVSPHFTLPIPTWSAILAIMPIAVATIPESTAHLFQIDIYVNNLTKKRGVPEIRLSDKLGTNLVGDGIGDIVSAAFGGPAGTNYGENISTMAITRIFSVPVLIAAGVLAIIISFFGKFSALVNTIPTAVIGGLSVYLFGVIAVQGIGIIVEKKVDLFDNRSLAVISSILVIGIGGSFAFPNGMIPFFGMELPAIATAAIWGILLNAVLLLTKKDA